MFLSFPHLSTQVLRIFWWEMCRALSEEVALDFFRSVDTTGLADVITFSAMISACGSGESWQNALAILDLMPRRTA